MSSLTGRRILITGISRGVGFETARTFLAEGADVFGVAREPERLEQARCALSQDPKRLRVLALDVAEAGAAMELSREIGAHWGALDILFNNAGVQIDGAVQGLSEATDATLEQAFAVNLWAPYRLSLALLPLLRRGSEPRIVNVSSGAGTLDAMKSSGIPTYRLSKWALNGLTLLLAAELAGTVAVNAFDPGWVKTDLGGPNAPGTPVESARGALALVTLPFSETGKFWKDGNSIPF
jgi:NAD(P)-dependent dehydrogenase (short-subunit alcohol dehydrogenase family)